MDAEKKNQTFLVVGTGISGIAALKLLAGNGAHVILFDNNTNITREEVQKKIEKSVSDSDGKTSEQIEFDLVLGELSDRVIERTDIAVLSPGVPTDLPFVIELQERRIPIWGEIELAYRFAKGRLFAITGTNGKTTTTALTGEIMKNFYKSVYVVGNIGLPYTEYASKMTEETVTVAEISSFQLETIDRFRPEISAILNITPDHLDRHHTMECYIHTKSFIAKNQTKDQVCVLNYEDENLRKLANEIPAKIFWFSSERKLEQGIYLDGEQIVYCDKEPVPICSIHEMNLLGKHNYENVMAATAIAMHAGVSTECIRKTVKEFQAVEHRIEFVKEVNGVKYYNDSKGTNPDAAIKAVEAMTSPTVLIGGGYDKKASYDEWISSFQGKVKCLVLLGQTKEAIWEAAKKAGFTDVVLTDSLEEAVKVSSEKAQSGDAVLLSPACASWGMFKNYEERGRLFKEYVRSL